MLGKSVKLRLLVSKVVNGSVATVSDKGGHIYECFLALPVIGTVKARALVTNSNKMYFTIFSKDNLELKLECFAHDDSAEVIKCSTRHTQLEKVLLSDLTRVAEIDVSELFDFTPTQEEETTTPNKNSRRIRNSTTTTPEATA